MFTGNPFDTSKIRLRASTAEGVGDRFLPALRMTVTLEYSPRPATDTVPVGRRQDWHLTILEHRLNLLYEGVAIATSGVQYEPIEPYMSKAYIYIIPISRAVLQMIEAKRKDDIALILSLGGLCLETDNVLRKEVTPFGIQEQKTFSQAQWTKLLSELGFSDTWIIEVSRPKVSDSAGMADVHRFLSEAEAELATGSPDDVISKCRKALDALRGAFPESKWKKVGEEIDAGSPGQEGKSPKSERFQKMLDSAKEWTHIGPHADKYHVSFDDARLCYQQVVSLVGFVSQVAKKLPE